MGKTASAKKCSVVRTYCGHGIGSLFHTAPNIPHYRKNKAKGIMKAGHVFTVEPMINLGVHGDITWGDNWTAVTSDGKRSAQFEHTVLVTDKGCEILTARDNEPVMSWTPDLINPNSLISQNRRQRFYFTLYFVSSNIVKYWLQLFSVYNLTTILLMNYILKY